MKRLICGDCFKCLDEIQSWFTNYDGLVYCDPPFNIQFKGYYNDKVNNEQGLSNFSMLFDKLCLIEGIVIVFHIAGENFANIYKMMKKVFKFVDVVIWDTGATANLRKGVYGNKSFGRGIVRSHDYLFFGYNRNLYHKLWRIFGNEFGWLDILSDISPGCKGVRLADYDFYIEVWEEKQFKKKSVVPQMKLYPVESVWKDIYSFMQSEVRVSESFGFSSQKPENLLRRIIQITSNPKDLVVDLFAGTGTAVAVAHKLNRNWVGIEKDRNIFEEFLCRRMEIVAEGDKTFYFNNKKRRSHLSRDINYEGILEEYETHN